jgi:hypothetical protein
MRLKHKSLQLLIILMTLTATELFGASEPVPFFTHNPPGSSTAGASSPDHAALIGRDSLRELVTKDNAAILGFEREEEADKVVLGEGFDVYQVDLPDLLAFDPASGDVTLLLKKTASRIYPLLTERPGEGLAPKARSALVVSLRKDKVVSTQFIWTTTSWGLAQLARAISEYRARFSGFGTVVWIPALNLHFLGDKVKDKNLMLIPLADRKTYGLSKGVPILATIVFALYAREAKSLDPENPG